MTGDDNGTGSIRQGDCPISGRISGLEDNLIGISSGAFEGEGMVGAVYETVAGCTATTGCNVATEALPAQCSTTIGN